MALANRFTTNIEFERDEAQAIIALGAPAAQPAAGIATPATEERQLVS